MKLSTRSGTRLTIERRGKITSDNVTPMERMTIRVPREGIVVVRDGLNREYLRVPARGQIRFTVAGALGYRRVSLEDDDGRTVAQAGFRVDCETHIADGGGQYGKLLRILQYTLLRPQENACVLYGGRLYRLFTSWLRDHVHTLKGSKYFESDVKTGLELYRQMQRKDGMLHDWWRHKAPDRSCEEMAFGRGGFVKSVANRALEFARVPVENDLECLFIEGIYFAWKASGDGAWMKSMLPGALKAYRYGTTDPYRWSRKYGLLKRGFTIDTWDYQPFDDERVAGDITMIDKDRTRFGVMFGDNTGFAMSCRYLAEMLDHVGLRNKAAAVRETERDIRARLDRLSWNGRFFIHHVPEDPTVSRDLGVDLAKQVSLSNAYSTNRGIRHDQAVAIIRTYKDIRRRMPKSSPGEWYAIYPPFTRGFHKHHSVWEYMGGVTTIVAGELAHGAFEHGDERYGVDILSRLLSLAEMHGDYLPCCFKGKVPERPKRRFRTLDLSPLANVDLRGNGASIPLSKRGMHFNSELALDLTGLPCGRQTFRAIPFEIPRKGRKGMCIGFSTTPGYVLDISVPVGKKAKSIYVLHTVSDMPGGTLVGTITLVYSDGSRHRVPVRRLHEVDTWWFPTWVGPRRRPEWHESHIIMDVVWNGRNKSCDRVGVTCLGIDNPHPNKTIDHLLFEGPDTGSHWFVLGVTLCDKPVYIRRNDLSFGIPDRWAAAAVTYALVEGLAGVKDVGVAFDRLLLAPRWAAAGVRDVTVTVKYEASGGYVRYCYQHDPRRKSVRIDVTGSSQVIDMELLLPKGKHASEVHVNGKAVKVRSKRIGRSRYACFPIRNVGAHRVEVTLC